MKRAFTVRFVHYRTWTDRRAVPACDPAGATKVSREGQTSPDRDKVTCGACIARMEEAGIWRAA
jgi:hypothetical protein